MNVAFRDGLLQGYRLSGEFVLPISQNLEGPQLGADMGVTIAVTRMLGG
jgi:hypothetical protein